MGRLPARPPRRLLLACAALLLPALAGCAAAPRLERRLLTADEFLAAGRAGDPPASAPFAPRDAAGVSPYLKAHLRDGRCVVLAAWSVTPDGRAVAGPCRELDVHRQESPPRDCTVPLDSVALFETNVVSPSTGPVASLGFMTGVSLAMTIYCAANPKACFGSCPTFYVRDDDGAERLEAEGFSASVAPALEATDVDALPRARPRNGRLELLMRNEALETHVVRRADLLRAPRGAGERVFATPDGRFHACGEVRAPLRATAAEGDCLDLLRDADGMQRASRADSLDLAAREEIDLEFAPAGDGAWGLVVASRQTLLTTWLFYRALAALGDEAGACLAALERGDAAARARVVAAGDVLGGVEVLVRDPGGAWRPGGWTRETGPLATDTRVVPLPPLPPGPVVVRLRLARGAWRLDQVALARLDRAVEPRRLPPAAASRDGVPDTTALVALRDPERALTTLPGDSWLLTYELPADDGPADWFLESRGYYLEWMREEWRGERDPALAALLLTAPRAALRVLAPAYRRDEPRLEDAFWGSRYVRP